MKSQFIQDISPIQQKGRSVPTHLHERAERESNKLIDQKHIINFDICSGNKSVVQM